MCRASIIIPAYNAEKYIEQTLISVMNQSYSDFECIVIDDGSSDNTTGVVRNFNDERVKLIEQSNSGGPAKPRNVGLAEASGEYIFIFDSDDIMHPEKVKLSVTALQECPNADLLFTNFSSIDENNNVVKENFLSEYDTFFKTFDRELSPNEVVELEPASAYLALMKVNYIGTSSVVLRRSALSRNDRFNEDMKNADDYLFWATFLKTHKAIYLNSILHKYRIQRNGISNRSYLKRGPGRIAAMTEIRNNCSDDNLIKILSKKLSNEYISMASSYKDIGNHYEQLSYSKKSFQMVANFKAIALFMHAVIKCACGPFRQLIFRVRN